MKISTPIADYIDNYKASGTSRLHMPGHKGECVTGHEADDITEISGADSLYYADGIIAESESNASLLFGTKRSFYSTEGSSQCIKAMVYLAVTNWRKANPGKRPVIVAARNVHTSFVHAVGLVDADIEWLWPEHTSGLCSCVISPNSLIKKLGSMEEAPAAVYITSPDYLGGISDIRALAKAAHAAGTLLLVDNAHGAYLRFLPSDGAFAEYSHPMVLGADMCCDSAHKTLPVLTGGAYLHISKACPDFMVTQGKKALALFGSTSPSYLIMKSLDMCNLYISDGFQEKLADTIHRIDKIKKTMTEHGAQVMKTDPLKLTMKLATNSDILSRIRSHGIEYEYADPDFIVFMLTPSNTPEDMDKLLDCLMSIEEFKSIQDESVEAESFATYQPKTAMSVREALMAPSVRIAIHDAVGRICASPTVSCPPAIPIAVSGEVIDAELLRLFEKYNNTEIDVVD